MKISLLRYLIISVCIQSCLSKSEEFKDFDFFIEKTISFENEAYSIDNVEFRALENSLIFGYDMTRAVVFKFDENGKLLKSNRFQNGENEIDFLNLGDVYPINEDSVFVLESGYDQLLLLDSDLKIKDSWNIRKITDSKVAVGRSNPQIVNFEYIEYDPYITLVALDPNYSLRQKEFFEQSFLAVKLNLTTGEYKTLFKYPKETPYREYLFWGDESPYILLHESEYYLTFPLDPNLYIFKEDSDDYQVIRYRGSLNKNAVGVNFGMSQSEFLSDHYLEVFHNNNDFHLISRNIFSKEGKNYFVRVSRRAINQNNFKFRDLNSFRIQYPGQDYIIQFIDLSNLEKDVFFEFKLPKEYKNCHYIDDKAKLYFNKTNEESEKYSIDVVDWIFDNFN
ncbi:hypothetical protein [Arthrospiribacter ruber]|uniref:6-bladed beta-propeller protein n=1 Tax=Arthrospiribacter ruber TaxID=2487934 RepID=A0A951J2L9_9BACT|nr:hypothetical protein [Arthrospiribacter ruber]MBW3470152.1 hypothetical protein [Arthrospiribacter ruber]